MRRFGFWILAGGVSVVLVGASVSAAGVSSRSSAAGAPVGSSPAGGPVRFGGTWALEDTCTNPCAGAGQIFLQTIVIVQKPGSSSFTGVNNIGETIEGTQSGLSVHCTETLNGYPDELATMTITIAKDGSTFTGSYVYKNGSGGTIKAARQSVPLATAHVRVSFDYPGDHMIAIGKTTDVRVRVRAGQSVDLTSVTLGSGVGATANNVKVTQAAGITGFPLAAGTSREFDFKVTGVRRGTLELFVAAKAKSAQGDAQGGAAAQLIFVTGGQLDPPANPVAKVIQLKSTGGGVNQDTAEAFRTPAGGGTPRQLAVGDEIGVGDTITTTTGSIVALEFMIGGRVGVNVNSDVMIVDERSVKDTGNAPNSNDRILLRKFGLWDKALKLREPLEIQTNGGVMGIKG
jgi:hypothetical protein